MSEETMPAWDWFASHQRVALRDQVVEMHVGIADWERHPDKKQNVVVSVELYARLKRHPAQSIEDCINYDTIHEYVAKAWSNRPHTDLLESLAEELVGVCLRDPKVEAVRVTLQKPDVYNDTKAAEVQFFRLRSDMGP